MRDVSGRVGTRKGGLSEAHPSSRSRRQKEPNTIPPPPVGPNEGTNCSPVVGLSLLFFLLVAPTITMTAPPASITPPATRPTVETVASVLVLLSLSLPSLVLHTLFGQS